MTSATVIGSTGLVGRNILTQLLASPTTSTVGSITRRNQPADVVSSAKLRSEVSSDTPQWGGLLSTLIKSTSSTILFSGLGTTRGDSGGFEKQRAIDYDLNLELAKSAAAAGVKIYVLISTGGANKDSFFAYSKMKGELEDEVAKLGFEKVAILRPGWIVGDRESPRLVERPFHALANALGAIHGGVIKDAFAQDATVIARAAIRAATEEALWSGRNLTDGENGGKVWIMGQSEIVEIGKHEK